MHSHEQKYRVIKVQAISEYIIKVIGAEMQKVMRTVAKAMVLFLRVKKGGRALIQIPMLMKKGKALLINKEEQTLMKYN